MPALMQTRDARPLGRVGLPVWAAWLPGTVAAAGGIAIVVFALFAPGPPTICTADEPCGPDPLGGVVGGLFLATMLVGFVDRGAVAVTAGLTAALSAVWAMAYPAWAGLWWHNAILTGWPVVVCWLAWRATRMNGAAAIEDWAARVPKEVPTPQHPLPTRREFGRYAGMALIVAGLCFAAWGVDRQHRADTRLAAATVVSATVTRHVDDDTLELTRPDQPLTQVDVLDVRAYPVGTSIALAVDDLGLRQPLAEPYDAGGWYLLGVLSAGCGMALMVRAHRRRTATTRLLTEAQPATVVLARPALDGWLLYPHDAAPDDPPLGELRLVRQSRTPELDEADAADDPEGADADDPEEADADDGAIEPPDSMLPAMVAVLYGVPVRGAWCTLDTGDGARLPLRPLRTPHDPVPRGPLMPA